MAFQRNAVCPAVMFTVFIRAERESVLSSQRLQCVSLVVLTSFPSVAITAMVVKGFSELVNGSAQQAWSLGEAIVFDMVSTAKLLSSLLVLSVYISAPVWGQEEDVKMEDDEYADEDRAQLIARKSVAGVDTIVGGNTTVVIEVYNAGTRQEILEAAPLWPLQTWSDGPAPGLARFLSGKHVFMPRTCPLLMLGPVDAQLSL